MDARGRRERLKPSSMSRSVGVTKDGRPEGLLMGKQVVEGVLPGATGAVALTVTWRLKDHVADCGGKKEQKELGLAEGLA